LVIISFFFPGDCLGEALEGAGGSVETIERLSMTLMADGKDNF